MKQKKFRIENYFAKRKSGNCQDFHSLACPKRQGASQYDEARICLVQVCPFLERFCIQNTPYMECDLHRPDVTVQLVYTTDLCSYTLV
jgi:hypothetical protein